MSNLAMTFADPRGVALSCPCGQLADFVCKTGNRGSKREAGELLPLDTGHGETHG